MKNKIQKFSKGDFHKAHPDVIFGETNLVLIIGEGEVYKGSFTMKSRMEGNIRGLIYPSSFRVHFKDQGFEGNPVRVEFTYDGRGLKPGHVEKGKFTVVCNGGEYELAFTAIIEKPYVTTNYGKVQSTDDFRKLAIKDYSEAARLFRSREFYEILKYENDRILYLYDNMRKWSLGEQALEEFLVGIKQKECIFITLPGEGMLFEDITESTKGTMTLTKNTWGFMPIRIEAEGDFLSVIRPETSTDDFVGNIHEIEYIVRPEKLHGGRNFGAIRFITPYEVLIYEVEVLQNQNCDENIQRREFMEAQIIKEYIGYNAGRIELNSWVESAVEKMIALRKLDPQSEMYQLMQAHIYVLGCKVEEAKWILENYNYNRFAIGKNPVINCYYLYLTALIRGRGNHVERVLDEIGKTYMKHQDSWKLLQMILDLDPKYKSPLKRIEVLEQQYDYDNHQVLFYLEAYKCYAEKPTLLKKLGKFEVQVLNFAAKQRLMTKELALCVANLASQQKNYSNAMFHILEQIYKIYNEPTILNTICTLLIKGNKAQKRYFEWYQKAVDAGIKIAQLYEYYMMTIDEERVQAPLPKVIFLYFLHGNALNYKKLAFLYANLISYEEDGDLYLDYREQMVSFTWNQLMKRHITDSLRVLYKRFCAEAEMNSERMDAMLDICHSYLVTTKVRNMNCILVIEKDGSIRQRIPYDSENGAIICLYDKESRVIWESIEGRYYTDSIAYETKRLFYEPRFLEICKEYADNQGIWHQEKEKQEVTFEAIQECGIEQFDEKDVFVLCSRKIREDNYVENEFLSYLCFELFKRQQYDKITLMYLASYYCGSTSDMKTLWKVLKEYGIPTYKIGERIITQMVFSEDMYNEEDIFDDYYRSDNVYFRVKQAYLAYVSREFLLNGRMVSKRIFDIIANEQENNEELPDICKAAMLKYYSDQEYSDELEPILGKMLRQMCEKQIVFPFYLNYKESWLQENQLYDKVMIEYHAKPSGRVKLNYKMRQGKKEELGYRTEILLPVYESIYVKQFVLFDDESISYYIQESRGKEVHTTEKEVLVNDRNVPNVGRYGRINAMTKMSPAKRKKAMLEYKQENKVASEMFDLY